MFKPTIDEDSNSDEDIILNAAYLVPVGHDGKLSDEIDRLASEYSDLGFRYELHGPWPPYHFVGEPSSGKQKVLH